MNSSVTQADSRLRHQNVMLVAYLSHLIVPLMFLFDELIAWSRADVLFTSHSSDVIVGTISLLWIAIGLTVFAVSPDRALFLDRASGPTTTIYVLFLSLFLFELIAQAVFPPPNQIPSVRVPNTRMIYDAKSEEIPGVEGRKVFTVNEVGLRGPSFPNDPHTYKIITIGGSTTECAALDDSEAWPHLVAEKVNQRQIQYPVWVGNAGFSGHNTVDHLVLIQNLPVVGKVNLLIFLTGINDLGAALAFEGGATQTHLERNAERMRESILAGGVPHYKFPLYKHSQLFRALWMADIAVARKLRPETRQQEWMGGLSNLRRLRAEAKILPVPDLQTGLSEYRERLIRLVKQCKLLRVRCLFLTQPSIWRSDLTPTEQGLLWWGNIGPWGAPEGYASITGLAKAMDAYNRTLLNVCQQSALECYDLASAVPRNTSAFYDDQHFNEQGARIVAHHLVDYLLSKPPFSDVRTEAWQQGNRKSSALSQ
jgi:lysophospholipase L1-like esterase